MRIERRIGVYAVGVRVEREAELAGVQMCARNGERERVSSGWEPECVDGSRECEGVVDQESAGS
eukprot:8099397-Lingulodinium_polyedra.AAC.1